MATWAEDIKTVLRSLGGVAGLEEIYREMRDVRPLPHPDSFNAIIRRELESKSSDSESFLNKEDCFESVEGIGRGIWGLRELSEQNFAVELACDLVFDFPSRKDALVHRIIRDTSLARKLKLLHKNQCQLCGLSLDLYNRQYSEAHHIQPLGGEHQGPDIAENILVVCPNCHVQLDFGAVCLVRDKICVHPKHTVGAKFVDYHNEQIWQGDE